jgi:hypothetical protein
MVSSFKSNSFTLLFSTLVMGCEYHDVNFVKLRPGGILACAQFEARRSDSAYIG